MTYGEATVFYGFGWEAGSEARWPRAVRDAAMHWDGIDAFGPVEYARLLASGFDRVEADEHGMIGYYDEFTSGLGGVFFYAASRRVDVSIGALARFDRELVATDVETELAEYAQLVKLARALEVDPDGIGWHVAGAVR